MKDLFSSKGGVTYPAPQSSTGTLKALVVRNQSEFGRRLAILTEDESLMIGHDVHAADYAFDPEDVEIPTGFSVGKAIDLAGKRNYFPVFSAVRIPYPSEQISELVRTGRYDLAKYGQMSDLITEQDPVGSVKHFGPVVATSELFNHNGLINNYQFSFTLSQGDVNLNIVLDALKHPARMTADLNSQLAERLPGVKGFIQMEPDAEEVGLYTMTLHLSVNKHAGHVEMHPCSFDFAEPLTSENSTIKWHAPHLNSEMTEGVRIELDASTPIGNDIVLSNLTHGTPLSPEALFAQHETMEDVELQERDGFLWYKKTIGSESFAPYSRDPRFNIAILELNMSEMPGQTLKLKGVQYQPINFNDDPVPADLLVVSAFGNVVGEDGGEEFNTVLLQADASIQQGRLTAEFPFTARNDADVEIGELAGVTGEILAHPNVATEQKKYYIAVITRAEQHDQMPMFREPNGTTLILKMQAVQHLGHRIDSGLTVELDYDDVYLNPLAPLTLPTLQGHFEDDEIVEGRVMVPHEDFIEFEMQNMNIGVDRTELAYTLDGLSLQTLLSRGSYFNTYRLELEMKSLKRGDTAYLGYMTNRDLEVVMNYPSTDLGLTIPLSTTWLKGRPGNNMSTPFELKGRILGGFAGAPLKHATAVNWSLRLGEGETPDYVYLPQTVLPEAGSLGDEFTFLLDKADFDGMVNGSYPLAVVLEVTYPWESESRFFIADQMLHISDYVETGDKLPNVVPQSFSIRIPKDATLITISDANEERALYVIDNIQDINNNSLDGDNELYVEVLSLESENGGGPVAS